MMTVSQVVTARASHLPVRLQDDTIHMSNLSLSHTTDHYQAHGFVGGKTSEYHFSPHPKRKVGGGEHIGAHEVFSPAKRLKFSKELSFWESGSGYLVGPDGKMADYISLEQQTWRK
jgi:hypothetical protein